MKYPSALVLVLAAGQSGAFTETDPDSLQVSSSDLPAYVFVISQREITHSWPGAAAGTIEATSLNQTQWGHWVIHPHTVLTGRSASESG
jgi:hypothetical protein